MLVLSKENVGNCYGKNGNNTNGTQSYKKCAKCKYYNQSYFYCENFFPFLHQT